MDEKYKRSDAEFLLERLRNGETIRCEKCGIGHYDVSGNNISKNNSFHCDNCDNYVHVNFPVDIE